MGHSGPARVHRSRAKWPDGLNLNRGVQGVRSSDALLQQPQGLNPATARGVQRDRPPGGNTVSDMAETDIETRDAAQAALPPSALVSEIERTRADLARTIDEIADRVSPGNVARRTADHAKERLSQVDPLVGGAVALAAVSVTCYMIWRRLRK
jgi:hypothetical protein